MLTTPHGKINTISMCAGDLKVVDLEDFIDIIMKDQSLLDRIAEMNLLGIENDDNPCVYNVPVMKKPEYVDWFNDTIDFEATLERVTVQLTKISTTPHKHLCKHLLDQAVVIKTPNTIKIDPKNHYSIIDLADFMTMESVSNFNIPDYFVKIAYDQYLLATLKDIEFKTAIRDNNIYAGIILKRKSLYRTRIDVVK